MPIDSIFPLALFSEFRGLSKENGVNTDVISHARIN